MVKESNGTRVYLYTTYIILLIVINTSFTQEDSFTKQYAHCYLFTNRIIQNWNCLPHETVLDKLVYYYYLEHKIYKASTIPSSSSTTVLPLVLDN